MRIDTQIAVCLLVLPAISLAGPAGDVAGGRALAMQRKIQELGLEVSPGIVYKEVNGEKLLMDFYHPRGENPGRAPVMMYIHGGGWGKGDRFKLFGDCFVNVLKGMTDSSIACAAIEYRLAKRGAVTTYDSLVDCFDAARYLMKEAERYRIDPDRMGTWGGSAGGHLSLVTALAPEEKFRGLPDLAESHPEFVCCLSYFPLASFVHQEIFGASNFRRPARLVPILGGFVEEKRELADLMSPVLHLSKDSPPVLVIHGDADTVLPKESALLLEKTGKETGAPLEALIVKGAEHGLRGENIDPPLEEVDRRAMEFLKSSLKPGTD